MEQALNPPFERPRNMEIQTFLWLMGLRLGPPSIGGPPPPPPLLKGVLAAMPDVFPQSAEAYAIWLGTYNTVVGANLAGYGLVVGDLADTIAAKTNIDALIVARDLAREAAKAAPAALSGGLATGKAAGRASIRKINGQAVATPDLIIAAGMKVKDTDPTAINPVAPSDLVVTARADGTHTMQWKANGNKSGTLYLPHVKIGEATTWTMLEPTTKTSFQHTGNTPGVKVTYMVKARRRDITGPESNIAVVYP